MLTPNDHKPNAFEQTIIESLNDHIRTLSAQHGGLLSFHDFMQAVLYTPALGYYMNTKPKLGRDGDFTTAPEISPLFGQCIANQLDEIMPHLQTPCIIEFGAGTGKLASTILTSLRELPEKYYIIELSGYLQQLQYQTLLAECPKLLDKVHWVTELPDPIEGIVIANEVLDAMPIHLVQIAPNQNLEYAVIEHQHTWQWQLEPLRDERLHSAINNITQAHPDILSHPPYTTELNLYIEPWLQNITKQLTKGCVLLFDYGFPAREYYHPDRDNGTLMCHYRHRSHTNPLCLPGVQDITAHVDFTAVAIAANHCDMQIGGFTNLAYFLLGAGIDKLINPITLSRADYQAKQALLQLTSPSEMGELFKAMQLNKNLDLPLTGFKLRDMRYRL